MNNMTSTSNSRTWHFAKFTVCFLLQWLCKPQNVNLSKFNSTRLCKPQNVHLYKFNSTREPFYSRDEIYTYSSRPIQRGPKDIPRCAQRPCATCRTPYANLSPEICQTYAWDLRWIRGGSLPLIRGDWQWHSCAGWRIVLSQLYNY
jgi:hypothetical protein